MVQWTQVVHQTTLALGACHLATKANVQPQDLVAQDFVLVLQITRALGLTMALSLLPFARTAGSAQQSATSTDAMEEQLREQLSQA